MTDRGRPVLAGLITALVGYTSSFAVVLAGLRAVGATSTQAASGLLALSLTMGAGAILLAWRTKLPVTLAWSTPGAALLVGTGAVAGGWPAAVGAFLITGVLIGLTAVWPALGRLIGKIPTPLAQAMLAGVLLSLCLVPVRTAIDVPLLMLPVLAVWLILLRLAPRWAVPAAFGVVVVIIVIGLVGRRTPPAHSGLTALVPHPVWTTPTLTGAALIGIALPLYVVTMASQNVPGVAVLGSYGYRVPWRPTMAVTGIGSLLGAPFGGHAINLAAVTAALAASPEADPDPDRRWIAARTAGLAYLVLGLLSPGLVALVALAPSGLVEAAAGLALIPTLAASLSSALARPEDRVPALATFLVAGAGISVLGVGPAFWALVVGVVCWLTLRVTRGGSAADPARATDQLTARSAPPRAGGSTPPDGRPARAGNTAQPAAGQPPQ